MSEPSSSRPSPFAHRAKREPLPVVPAETAAPAPPPSPVSPEPAVRRGSRAGAYALASAAALLAFAGVYFALADAPPRSAPHLGEITDSRRLAEAEARYSSAVESARRRRCDKASPSAFAVVTAREASARASAAAGDVDAAVAAFDAGAAASLSLCARADMEACRVALARLPDFPEYSGEAGREARADLDGAERAFASGDLRAAAGSAERAANAMPQVLAVSRSRLKSLAAGAEARGDLASAAVFMRKLIDLGGDDPAPAEWFMRRGLTAGASLLSPKLGLPLAYVAPAKFLQGAPVGETGRESDEVRRPVTLTRGYWMGVTEVTQSQWDAVMGAGAAAARLSRERGAFRGGSMPMVCVSWHEAVEFCRRLSVMEGVRFRLPSEAEWECACRAGSESAYAGGRSFLRTGEAVVDEGVPGGPDAPRPVDAASTAVNAWGLRDMHGNVWEWCSDWYGPWTASAATDPAGPDDVAAGRADLAMKVARGGSWNDPALAARSANRWQYAPSVGVNYIGFRVLMEFDANCLPPAAR